MRLLGLVRMLGPTNDFQLLEYLSSERVPRQHAFDGTLQYQLWRTLQEMLEGLGLKITDIAGMPIINLIL